MSDASADRRDRPAGAAAADARAAAMESLLSLFDSQRAALNKLPIKELHRRCAGRKIDTRVHREGGARHRAAARVHAGHRRPERAEAAAAALIAEEGGGGRRRQGKKKKGKGLLRRRRRRRREEARRGRATRRDRASTSSSRRRAGGAAEERRARRRDTTADGRPLQAERRARAAARRAADAGARARRQPPGGGGGGAARAARRPRLSGRLSVCVCEARSGRPPVRARMGAVGNYLIQTHVTSPARTAAHSDCCGKKRRGRQLTGGGRRKGAGRSSQVAQRLRSSGRPGRPRRAWRARTPSGPCAWPVTTVPLAETRRSPVRTPARTKRPPSSRRSTCTTPPPPPPPRALDVAERHAEVVGRRRQNDGLGASPGTHRHRRAAAVERLAQVVLRGDEAAAAAKMLAHLDGGAAVARDDGRRAQRLFGATASAPASARGTATSRTRPETTTVWWSRDAGEASAPIACACVAAAPLTDSTRSPRNRPACAAAPPPRAAPTRRQRRCRRPCT